MKKQNHYLPPALSIYFMWIFVLLIACQVQEDQNGKTEAVDTSNFQSDQDALEESEKKEGFGGLIQFFEEENQGSAIPQSLSKDYLGPKYFTALSIISPSNGIYALAVGDMVSAEYYAIQTFSDQGESLDSKVLLASEGGDVYHYSLEFISDTSFMLTAVLDLSLYNEELMVLWPILKSCDIRKNPRYQWFTQLTKME